jgi:hypothetical protein
MKQTTPRMKYNPKSAFDDRSLPATPNRLTVEQEEALEKKILPELKRLIDELKKTDPDLFKGSKALHKK